MGYTIGCYLMGGFRYDGMVNSESRSIENSLEKIKANQKRISMADVFGESMDPLLTDNSKVPIIEMPSGTTYEIGDIIVFKGDGFNVIHRVDYVFTYNGETYYVTEGINNKFVDDAIISGNQIIGKADFSKETFEAARELAKQNKLRRYTVHALTKNQINIKKNIENEVSDLAILTSKDFIMK